MAPPRSGNTSRKPNKKESSKKKPSSSSSQAQPRRTTSKTDPNHHHHHHAAHQNHELNISTTIPLTLQQLLLNVFKTALLTNGHNYLYNREETKQNDDDDAAAATTTEATGDPAEQQQQEQLDIKSLIQTIKTHLYNRDFDSAFTDANEDLLRAYALRWSSSRALGYAGIFRALLKEVIKPVSKDDDAAAAAAASTKNVVCIGGGAGAEIVALAAAWRDFLDGAELPSSSASEEGQIADAVKAVSLDDGIEEEEKEKQLTSTSTSTSATATSIYPGLSVTAVDIADWSKVVERLSTAIRSPTVTGSKSHLAPLLPSSGDEENKKKTPGFNVQFEKIDVLSAGEKELQGLFSQQGAEPCSTVLVTLMFTLNELFSTSMAKATGFLLRMTDLLRPGTVLLVVDSPGSYSTLKLGKGGDGEVRERQYPMKFLLDHTLLSVAEGKWERLLSQDSRWWRRDAARLRYDVGEGAGLEDMRFQVHVYRRVGE